MTPAKKSLLFFWCVREREREEMKSEIALVLPAAARERREVVTIKKRCWLSSYQDRRRRRRIMDGIVLFLFLRRLTHRHLFYPSSFFCSRLLNKGENVQPNLGRSVSTL